MDPQTPGELGDVADSEPERRGPERSAPAKQSLDQFLAEFERRLRDSPDEPATSAQAALEGRAQGIWRTPIEGSERPKRRLVRRPAWQPDPERRREALAPPIMEPDPAVAAADPEPYGLVPETDIEPAGSEPIAPAIAEALPAEVPAAGSTPPEAAADTEEHASRKRHRRHRRHRRK